MKIVFLIPPSEGKSPGGIFHEEVVSISFDKPKTIALNATEKDLKCKSQRYQEAIKLNKQLFSGDNEISYAIERYSGVMYDSIGYKAMSQKGKDYFMQHFIVVSGMYGLVKPDDKISNYKLPIETKGLIEFWGNKMSHSLKEMNLDYVVNLLPNSYSRLIDFHNIDAKVININFLWNNAGKMQKIAHGVKKIKGKWIKDICEKGRFEYKDSGGKIINNGESIDVNIIQ